MRYEMISADCHIDLCWLPPDLFVEQRPVRVEGPHAVRDGGTEGAGVDDEEGRQPRPAVRHGLGRTRVRPGKIHRSDRMAATGLYEDGKRGIRRLTEPELRIRDQDLDGVQGEVLYGILGATGRMNDPEAAVEVMRIYNEWLAEFCATHPERYAGLASIPNQPARGGDRRGRARRQARRAARAGHRQLVGDHAALEPVLESALGGHQRLRPAAALPHGGRLHPRPCPEDGARRQRSHARRPRT